MPRLDIRDRRARNEPDKREQLRSLGYDDATIEAMPWEEWKRILKKNGLMDPNYGEPATPGEAGTPNQNETRAGDEATRSNGHDLNVGILQTLAQYVVRSTFALKDGKPLSKAAKEAWRPAEDGLQLDLPQLMAHASKQKVIAVYPIEKGEDKTKVAVLDFDDHDKEVEWADMVDAAKRPVTARSRHSPLATFHRTSIRRTAARLPEKSSGGLRVHRRTNRRACKKQS
jgi:hypothetical protein